MGAELLEPFAKWGALVGGVLLVVALVRFWITQSAKEEQRLDTLSDTVKDQRDAKKDLRGIRRKFRAAWRRVRDGKGR